MMEYVPEEGRHDENLHGLHEKGVLWFGLSKYAAIAAG